MDGILPKDATHLPYIASCWQCKLYELIECGEPRPNDLPVGRLAGLLKPDEDPLRAESYRWLTILTWGYRLWARYRLRNLGPWIDVWGSPSLFAGLPGRGAADAWYLRASDLDFADMDELHLCGAAVDITKCYDEFVRPLLYRLADVTGAPRALLGPWSRYREALSCRFSFGRLSVGNWFSRRCSIPQGCPSSMTMLAVLTSVWSRLIPARGAIPSFPSGRPFIPCSA